ncbi:MAG TPA: cobalamin-dependent protein [Polyangiaceae bacterium]|nr:cobalamin-dependent protein [Polyangiaceae bacterium]
MAWVALIGPELEENLSLRYIAASLARAGYDSEIVPFNSESDFGPALEAILAAPEPPLVVGISLAFQWRAQDFLAFAVALRQAGYRGHITVGGHFATFASLEILRDFPELDSIVRQEAEETMVALTRAVEQGASIQGLAGLALRDETGTARLTPHAALPDIATLPWPDRRGEPAACFAHPIAPLVSSRGCYANCSFCCIAAWQEQSLPGKRYRLRAVEDVADEMVDMQRSRGVDIFVFHDDNFFVPGHKKNAARFSALADALESRGIGDFATVVKARPTDVDPTVFEILRRRLRCIRVYIGIETDADQGLQTLRRWSPARQNKKAIEVARSLDLYTCFNLLLFDPDTTLESLRTNIAFMRYASEYPSNFGRVELYAGTPLLARMQAEGRTSGDYLQWDYQLATPEVERTFELAMACFLPRNFGPDALANRIMGTRFDVEVCRHFHADRFDPAMLVEGKRLSSALAHNSADALAGIVDHVDRQPTTADDAFVAQLAPKLRACEALISDGARELARKLQRAAGRGSPLTDIGDRVATPLQTQRLAVGASA